MLSGRTKLQSSTIAKLILAAILFAGLLGVMPKSAAHANPIVAITRTPWEMNRGGSWSLLGFTLPSHGYITAYNNADIPAIGDMGWGPAPNPVTIGFSEASILPGYCLQAVDYTYFQTFVTVPAGGTVTTFTIAFSGIDDGGRVSIFNSTYPAGLIVAGSYVYLGGSGTSDLASYMTEGVNRIVVTQVDDCPVGNNLITGNVVLDGVVIPPNTPPTVDAGMSYTGSEGSAIAMSGASASDADMDTLTYNWSVDSALCSFDNALALKPNLTCADNGSFTATLSVSDGVNSPVASDAAVTVDNVAPTLGPITVDQALVPVNAAFNATAAFTDPGTLDTHTAAWDWGDTSTSAGTINEASGSGTASGSHSYSTPGVYTIKLTVTDKDLADSNQSVYQYVVVYDPSAGFVTGGGWIDSPLGAYSADLTLTGKANFGFVAKYKKGQSTPDGNTQFQFQAGNLNFHSTSYDWLVVAGANAKFKGVGTINGQGSYNFMITATDGNLLGGGHVDGFRIKIWDAGGVIYDNQMGQNDDSTSTTNLGGGSIVIHK
jgi:PKD domain